MFSKTSFQIGNKTWICMAMNENEVLRVSYCDSAMSVVRRPSCDVNFLPCVRSRGHIFSPIIMKLGQNVFLDKISNDLENGLCRVKN